MNGESKCISSYVNLYKNNFFRLDQKLSGEMNSDNEDDDDEGEKTSLFRNLHVLFIYSAFFY